MASIQKRGNNSWYLVVEAGYDAKGKRIRKTKTIKVEDKALLKTTKKLREHLESELHKFKIEVESGEYIAPEKMKFSLFVEEWRTKYGVKNLSPTVLEIYNEHLNNRVLPVFGHLRLDQIKTIQIVNFFAEISKPGNRKDGKEGSLSGTTLRYIDRTLRDILERAVEWKLIKENPMEGIEKPSIDTKEKEIFTEEELVVIFEKLVHEPLKWRVFTELAITTGMRRGEILAIDINKHLIWDKSNGKTTLYIDVRESVAKIKGQVIIKEVKTKKSKRSIAIDPELIPLIKLLSNQVRQNKVGYGEQWEGEERLLLFGRDNGLATYPDTPTAWFRDFLKKNKITKNVTLHGLRHTYATYLLLKGHSLKDIQELLGHSNMRITGELYTHFVKEMNERAAGAFASLRKKVK